MSAPEIDPAPPIGILSAGVYIPETFITAAEIAERSGVPEDVVIRKMGITRKPVAGPGDHTNAMGLWAAEDAVKRAGLDPEEIDLVLCTTEEWKEFPLWTAGVKLAYDLGARRAWAIDVQMRCATTMAVLKMAKAMMLGDPDLKTVLIAGGYRNGDWVDYTNQRARFLFSLAAGGGAILLQKGHPRNRLLESEVVVDGSFSRDVIIPVGGTVEPISAEAIAEGATDWTAPIPTP